jgi:hypothetical protein
MAALKRRFFAFRGYQWTYTIRYTGGLGFAHKVYLFSEMSRLDLGPTRPPVKWILLALPRE